MQNTNNYPLYIAFGVLALSVLFLTATISLKSTRGESVSANVPEVPLQSPSVFDVPLTAKSAVVYDVATDTVLFGLREQSQLPLASLAKLIVAYDALKTLSPTTQITISSSALLPEGDSGLAVGQTFTLDTLTRLALVSSSNDASEAIREATPKVADATLSAAAVLSQTYLLNGTGLDESGEVAGAYGSAKDIAVLLSRFYEEFPSVLSDTTYQARTYRSLEGDVFHVTNTDVLAGQIPRFLGGKTGLTDLAGGNLAVLYDAGMGRPVAVVVLGATEKSRFTDVSALLSATEKYFTQTSLQK